MEKEKKNINRIFKVLLIVAGILGGLSAFMATVNALLRKIASFSFPWAEELCTYAVVVAVFLAIPSLQWRGKQLSVDLLENSLKKKPAAVRGLHIFGSLISIAVCVVIVIYGWISSMTAIETNLTTYVLQWPRAIFLLIGVVSFAIAVISSVLNIIFDGTSYNEEKPKKLPAKGGNES